jgi:hypothetical protein
MAEQSIYSRGGSGMTRGGLDRYLGPEAQDSSSMPEDIEQPKPEEVVLEVDCAGADRNEPVCQIAKEEQKQRQGQ